MNEAELANATPEDQRLIAEAEKYGGMSQWPLAQEMLLKLWARGFRRDMTAMHLGDAYMNDGDYQKAVHWHRKALGLNGNLYPAQEHLIFLVDAQLETTEAEARAVRRDWWYRYGSAAYQQRQPHENDPDPDKRIRVGYVSGDYMFHSAAIAFTPVVTQHTPAIEPVFYSVLERERYDHRTKLWMDRYGDHFIDASGWSAMMLANTIRADQIDILVDLSGYTGNNRLLTFAYKPAPIQVQAWGYVLGTASPAIDVIFADPIVCPPEVRMQMAERVVDLPSVLSYLPRPDLPEATELPCLHPERVPVFSVFQRAMKLNADCLSVWRELMARVPEAQIQFKGADYSPNVRTRIADALDDYRGRISFDFQAEHKAHMLSYGQVDLALDPWPQTGGVSTLEALWMGVPCVTWLGPRMIQRASASFLTTLGLSECVTTTRDAYIEKAVALVTTDRDRLAEIRRTLRETMKASPIMSGYVDAVEAQYRTLWRTWCAEQREVTLWPKTAMTA